MVRNWPNKNCNVITRCEVTRCKFDVTYWSGTKFPGVKSTTFFVSIRCLNILIHAFLQIIPIESNIEGNRWVFFCRLSRLNRVWRAIAGFSFADYPDWVEHGGQSLGFPLVPSRRRLHCLLNSLLIRRHRLYDVSTSTTTRTIHVPAPVQTFVANADNDFRYNLACYLSLSLVNIA